MRFAENVEHALCREITRDLFPHDVAQVFLRDVRPDAQRHWEIHQIQPVGDDEHAVDRDLDADHIVVMRWGLVRHVCPTCIRARKVPLIASSARS
jgi:hypothetical protein